LGDRKQLSAGRRGMTAVAITQNRDDIGEATA
jgi:hypothetical protein